MLVQTDNRSNLEKTSLTPNLDILEREEGTTWRGKEGALHAYIGSLPALSLQFSRHARRSCSGRSMASYP